MNFGHCYLFSSIIAFPWTSTMVHGRKVSWTMSLMDALRWLRGRCKDKTWLEADVKLRPLSLSKKSISGNDYVFMPWTFSKKMHQGLLHILCIWILSIEKSHKFSVFLKHLPNKIPIDTWHFTSELITESVQTKCNQCLKDNSIVV
jgi:hypothetical protein